MRFALLVLVLLLPATALAAKPADRASARLLSCDAAARSAAFQGEMRAFGKAVGLAMRFTLQTRDAGDPGWVPVDAPSFDDWLAAEPGTGRYVYDKGVANLAPGAEYRASVRFRWRTAKGKVVARAVRRTRACRQPDERADLRAVKLAVKSGSEDDTRFYAVRVVNEGGSPAAPFATRVDVAGTVPPVETTGEPLPAGASEVFEFEAPACATGSTITATVDVGAAVDETDELDNVLSAPCPGR